MSLNITVCVCVIRGKKENVLSDIMKKKKTQLRQGIKKFRLTCKLHILMNTLWCRDNFPVVSVSPQPPQPIL